MRFLVGVFFLFLITSGVKSSRFIDIISTRICITNCGQCRQMFGHYFNGQICAESCIASKGRTSPDCNDPDTLEGLIQDSYRLY